MVVFLWGPCQRSAESWHPKWRLRPRHAVLMKGRSSQARVTSVFLTRHVAVIHSAYSCYSCKQINIYYSGWSIQARGDLWHRAARAALAHKGALWDCSIFSDHYLHYSGCMRQRRVTEESCGDSAGDINKQYGLCLTWLWAGCVLKQPDMPCHMHWHKNISYVKRPTVI